MIDYVAMGKRVRKYREAKGWNQSDLAYAVHMSNTTISHIEVGTGHPELNTVINIANALGVTADMLLCESLETAITAYKYELSDYMNQCSSAELRFINELLPSILDAFRRNVKINFDL